jgi:hypothetical protein
MPSIDEPAGIGALANRSVSFVIRVLSASTLAAVSTLIWAPSRAASRADCSTVRYAFIAWPNSTTPRRRKIRTGAVNANSISD